MVCIALQYNQLTEEDEVTKVPVTTKMVLDKDSDDEAIIEVDENLIRKLKPHQVEGQCHYVMWCCVLSLFLDFW